jgi:hypothetical protein
VGFTPTPAIRTTPWLRTRPAPTRNAADEGLDVGAQELGRAVTHVADEVEVAWMAIGRLEARPAFAEVDLSCHARPEHPLQRAVDGCPPNPGILLPNDVEEIVRAEMPLLTQEEAQDEVAFAGALAPCRAKARNVRKRAFQEYLWCPA